MLSWSNLPYRAVVMDSHDVHYLGWTGVGRVALEKAGLYMPRASKGILNGGDFTVSIFCDIA